MIPLTEDEIVERVYRDNGNSPTPQLRPVLRRIAAAGMVVVGPEEIEPSLPNRAWCPTHQSYHVLPTPERS